MTDIVIIFSSFTGNTRKVAQYLAKQVGADIFDLKLQTNIDLSSYSKVVLGTGIHAGKPYGKLVKFLDDNRSVLNGKSVYLFMDCLYKGERAEKQCESIAQDLKVSNSVFFSSRSPKNESGISTDVDVFAERLKA